jgi:hypothetical protein
MPKGCPRCRSAWLGPSTPRLLLFAPFAAPIAASPADMPDRMAYRLASPYASSKSVATCFR